MTDTYFNWIPYGAIDSSIIWADPLTNEANLLANGAVQQGASASQFDPILGMKPLGPVGNLTDFPLGDDSLGYLLTSILNYQKLIPRGQLTFEVERKALCVFDIANGSNGYDTSVRNSDPTFLSFRDSANEYLAFKLNKSAVSKRNVFQRTSSITSGITYHDTYPGGSEGNYQNETGYPEDFIRVNLAWERSGTNYILYTCIDGSPRERTTTSAGSFDPLTMFQRTYIGSQIASAQFVTPWWMRKLQISYRFPSLGARSSIGRTVLLSDSLFLDGTEDGIYKDAVSIGSFRRQISNSVPRSNKTTVDINAGYKMKISVGNDFSDILTNITNLYPKSIAFLGGTNDFAVADPAAVVVGDVIADYKTNITTLFNAGANNVAVCTLPTLKYNSLYDSPAHIAAIRSYNAEVRLLKVWAIATFPSKKLAVCDLYIIFGGESGDPNQWIGGFTGANDDLHWHALGHHNAGKGIANTFIANFL